MVHEIAANIIDPNKGSTWLGTPWHREDAWVDINKFCDVVKYPLSQFNFLGDKEAQKKRKMTTPFLFAINYELEIGADESLLFSEPVYSQGWDFTKKGAIAHLDAAYDGDHFCALTIMSPTKKMPEGQYYQAIGFSYPGNVKNWIDKIDMVLKKYKVTGIYNETNADKGYTADALRRKGHRVYTYAEHQNKHIKITTNLYEIWRFIEWDPATESEYIVQITDYREGSTPDDAPDSASSLICKHFPRKKGSGVTKVKMKGL
jgi:hypothetical protein